MDQGINVQAEIKELYPEESFVDKVKVEVWYERPVITGNIEERVVGYSQLILY